MRCVSLSDYEYLLHMNDIERLKYPCFIFYIETANLWMLLDYCFIVQKCFHFSNNGEIENILPTIDIIEMDIWM